MSKPMSEQMQKLAARYEKATGKKFNTKTRSWRNCLKNFATTVWRIVPNIGYTGSSGQRRRNRNEL